MAASETIARLAESERLALGHLVQCWPCQRLVERLAQPPHRPPPVPPAEILAELAGEIEATAERLAGDRQAAEARVAGLLASPPGDRRRRIENDPHLQTLAIVIPLLQRSLALAPGAPDEAENLALLALYTLGQLAPEAAAGRLAAELRAGAWRLVARACRLKGDWRAVREALERSDEALADGGYAAGRPPSRRVLAAIRLAERRADAAWRLDEASLVVLLRALAGEALG